MKFKLAHKVLVVVSLPVLFQLGYLAFLTNSFNKLAESQDLERAKTKILVARDRLDMQMSELAVLSTIYRATVDPLYKSKIFQSTGDLHKTFSVLSNLLEGAKKRLFSQVQKRYEENLRVSLMSIVAPQETVLGADNTNPIFLRMFSKMLNYQLDSFEANLGSVFGEEQASQLDAERRINDLSNYLKSALLVGLGASLFVGLACALFFSSSISSRLRIILLNIKSMEEGTFELRTAGGTDEIGTLDRTIRETAKEIQNAEQFQAHTVEIVADELERPLASLSTTFATLKQAGFADLSEKGRLRLERTDLEISRLRRLVNELALINTVKSARLDLQIAEIDLADTAGSAVEIVSDLARSKKVRLSCNPISVMVFADRNRVLQVVVNLLSNAIKFSPANSVVTIETSHLEGSGRLSVKDEGPGISEEFKSKIFTNFEQAHSSDAGKGTGLGLAISKKIIEQHSGQMGFDTTLAQGTAFWLTLPIKVPTEFGPLSPPLTNSKSWQSTFWKKGLVLIALPLMVNLVTFGTLGLVLHSMNENISEFRHARQVASLSARLIENLSRAVFYAFVFNVAQLETDREGAMSRRQDVNNTFSQLESLVSEKDGLSSKSTMRKLLDEIFKFQDEILQAPQNAKIDQWFGQKHGAATENLVLQAEKPIQDVLQHEEEMMEESTLASQEIRNLLNFVLLSSAVLSGAVSSGLALFMARRLSKRIALVAENVVRLAHRTLPNQPLQGNDELVFIDKALYEAASKLMELEKARQEIVAVSSHELRTPLMSLSVLTELITTGSFGVLTEDGVKYVEQAKETSDDLISMITNLLDLEKMQSGKMLLHKEQSQLDDILKTAAANLAPLAQKSSVELHLEDSHVTAELDKTRIIQALTSILRELIEELPAKSVVSLSCLGDKHRASIKISAPDAKQGSSITSRKDHAARQRLAIDLTKLIAEQHGGQLQIRSAQDKRVVTITLRATNSGSAA